MRLVITFLSFYVCRFQFRFSRVQEAQYTELQGTIPRQSRDPPVAMPVTYGSKVGEAFGKDTWLREDEWEIGLAHFPHFYGSSTDNQNIFRVCLHLHLCDSVTDMLTKISDTSGFTARRWATADELFSLPKADQELIGDVVTHKAFDDYVWNEISNASNASLRTALQSIAQLHKPLWLFENRIKESVDQHQEDVDTSSLWAMAYLNVKVRDETRQLWETFRTGIGTLPSSTLGINPTVDHDIKCPTGPFADNSS